MEPSESGVLVVWHAPFGIGRGRGDPPPDHYLGHFADEGSQQLKRIGYS